MKISYIPAATAASNITTDPGLIEKAISDAINSSIVIPFQAKCAELWARFVDTSFILCLAIAMAGVICGACGINKGYKWAIISILFYLFLRMTSYYMGWY